MTSSGDLSEIYPAGTAQNLSKLRAFILKVSEHLSTAWTRPSHRIENKLAMKEKRENYGNT